ncbi:MAG: DUF859 family phage minor structural protein [Lentihominibacter sp.]
MAASRVACASFNIGANTSITIMRDKSSYTHTLTYKFGSATGTIATKTSQTAIVWTPSAATFYAQIPNAVSGYGTVTCQTYDGNTLVGTTTATFYAYAVKDNCIPDLSAAVADTNDAVIAVTGNSAILVRYISKPKVTLTATAKNSATLKTYNIYNPVGLVGTTTPYTFDTVYTDTFRCTVTDSRGYSKSIDKVVENFIEYDPVHFDTFSIERTESTSTTAVFKATGFCFNGSFGSQSNTLTIKYRYKTTGSYGSYTTLSGVTWNSDGSFSITANITGISLTDVYTFEFVVEDKLSSYTSGEVALSPGIGDLRIAKDYAQFKNSVYSGDINNVAWRCFGARRKVNGVNYKSNFGTGIVGNDGAAVLELYQDDKIVSRAELRNDGHLYNLLTSMSFAEIMAMAPSSNHDGAQGYIMLNGGSSNPILIMWGVVYVTPSGANVPTTKSVSFLYRFMGIPYVGVDVLSGVPAQLKVSANSISETGFDIVLDRINTVTTSVTWLAIGNGTNALPE